MTTAATSSSSTTRAPELALFGLSALGIVAVVVLELTGRPVPPELYVAATAALTGGAGLALPRRAAGELEAVVATAEAFVARLEAARPLPAGAEAPGSPPTAAQAAAEPVGPLTGAEAPGSPPTAAQAAPEPVGPLTGAEAPGSPPTAAQAAPEPDGPPVVRSVP